MCSRCYWQMFLTSLKTLHIKPLWLFLNGSLGGRTGELGPIVFKNAMVCPLICEGDRLIIERIVAR